MTQPARPPLVRRLLFWAFALRVRPEYRPWVAAQVMDPRFQRRKLLGTLAVLVVLVVLPNTAGALLDHRYWRLLTPSVLLVGFSAASLLAKPLTGKQRERLLAYHGVTATGELRIPVSAWAASPVSKGVFALLVVQMLVLGTGVTVLVDRLVAQSRCGAVAAEHVRAIDALLGVPGIAGFAPPPRVPSGSHLVRARQVETFLAELHYVGGYVRRPDGTVVGPAVWRVLEPGGVLSVSQLEVSAYDGTARTLTPSAGYGYSTPEDPAIARARSCARWA